MHGHGHGHWQRMHATRRVQVQVAFPCKLGSSRLLEVKSVLFWPHKLRLTLAVDS